jgi:hypothetical protein
MKRMGNRNKPDENITKDIMRKTKKDSESLGEKIINGKKRWIRQCPCCDEEMSYSTVYSCLAAKDKNKKCRKCAHTGQVFSYETRAKISKSLTGKTLSDEVKKKISESVSGDKNGFYGKKHTISSIEKMKDNLPDRHGKNNSFYGKSHSVETKDKLSAQKLGTKMPPRSLEHRKKLSESHLGKTLSEEHRKKLSRSRIQFIIEQKKKNNTFSNAGFNRAACQFMDSIRWNLRHALNGGEFVFGGYFADGYNVDKNIWFEYDEHRHYNKFTGELIEYDIDRMKFILENLKCKFIRYNEREQTLIEYRLVNRKLISEDVNGMLRE